MLGGYMKRGCLWLKCTKEIKLAVKILKLRPILCPGKHIIIGEHIIVNCEQFIKMAIEKLWL